MHQPPLLIVFPLLFFLELLDPLRANLILIPFYDLFDRRLLLVLGDLAFQVGWHQTLVSARPDRDLNIGCLSQFLPVHNLDPLSLMHIRILPVNEVV